MDDDEPEYILEIDPNDLFFQLVMDIAETAEVVDLTEEPELVTEWEN